MDDALRWHARRPADAKPEPERTAATERFGGDKDEPVLIAVVGAPVESEMAREALREAGIPAYVKGNSLGPVYGLSIGTFGAAEIWAPAPLAEQARDVLIGLGLLDPEAE